MCSIMKVMKGATGMRGVANACLPNLCHGMCLLWSIVMAAVMLSVTGVCSQFTTHPMLFFSPEKVPTLIKQARTTHRKIASVLEEAAQTMLSNQHHYLAPADYDQFGRTWNEVYGNNLAALAMYCVLYPEDRDARDFALKFMDNMASLPRWQVKSSPNDEVPVAHSLTGFATAFDFLYPVLEKKRRDLYLTKIFSVTKQMYELSKFRSWGSQYLQNHVATNFLSLLHGSLVVSVHQEVAEEWVQHARLRFEKTMSLLDHIIDGSLDEGVAYGSYTSRSITQYAFLALRHFGVDHTQDLWLREHFWFYYSTILPKFQRTVGIADSNNNWFYGPESQLVFLDTFVMRNGHGNWLAEEIRKHRSMDKKLKLAPSESQRWCTIHTEFLWYDSTVKPKAPPQSGQPDLHVFSDWGVVTYSRVATSYPNDTFLAFKSGKMHGRGIFDIVQRNMYSSWVHQWKSFNPGHEHPDQNMFVFAPSGQPFITDGLYGPKFSYLNNVLMFSPSPTSQCFKPWEGQLGECEKWLGWRNVEVKKYGGELITASASNGMVHISGEARDGYHPKMRLASVYRSLVLLNPNLLVILDHVETLSSSPLTHVAAFFHNIITTFEQDKLGQIRGAKVAIEGKDYRMFWVSPEGRSPKALCSQQSHPSEFRKRDTNFVNVTMKLRPHQTRMAYAFVGPSEKIIGMNFLGNHENGVSFHIETKKMKYRIDTVTKHDDPIVRQQFLGYPGYVSVRRGTHLIKFGVNYTSGQSRRRVDLHSDNFNVMSLLLGLVMLGVVLMYLINRRIRRYMPRYKSLFLGACLVVCLVMVSWHATTCRNDSCIPTPSSSATAIPSSSPGLPSVVITSLPGSGSEILGWLFYYNPDFLHIQVPSDIVGLPEMTQAAVSPFADACIWTKGHLKRYPALTSKIQTLRWNWQTVFGDASQLSRHLMFGEDGQALREKGIMKRNVLSVQGPDNQENRAESQAEVSYKDYRTSDLLAHASKYPNAQGVLHFTSGSWGLKLQWLQGALGDTLRSIHVVRDPRAWVANFLRNNRQLYTSMNIAQHVQVLSQQLQAPCHFAKLDSANFYKLQGTPHKLLATLWAAYTEHLLHTLGRLGDQYRVVMYEDVVRSPRSMADNIYRFIGFPLPPSMEHQLVQAAHTGIFLNPHEGVIRPSTLDNWKTELTSTQIHDIETICGSAMAQLGYSQMGAEQ